AKGGAGLSEMVGAEGSLSLLGQLIGALEEKRCELRGRRPRASCFPFGAVFGLQVADVLASERLLVLRCCPPRRRPGQSQSSSQAHEAQQQSAGPEGWVGV